MKIPLTTSRAAYILTHNHQNILRSIPRNHRSEWGCPLWSRDYKQGHRAINLSHGTINLRPIYPCTLRIAFIPPHIHRFHYLPRPSPSQRVSGALRVAFFLSLLWQGAQVDLEVWKSEYSYINGNHVEGQLFGGPRKQQRQRSGFQPSNYETVRWSQEEAEFSRPMLVSIPKLDWKGEWNVQFSDRRWLNEYSHAKMRWPKSWKWHHSRSNVSVFGCTIPVFRSDSRFRHPWCYVLPFPFDLKFCG